MAAGHARSALAVSPQDGTGASDRGPGISAWGLTYGVRVVCTHGWPGRAPRRREGVTPHLSCLRLRGDGSRNGFAFGILPKHLPAHHIDLDLASNVPGR